MIQAVVRTLIRFVFEYRRGYDQAADLRDGIEAAIRQVPVLPLWAETAWQQIEAMEEAHGRPGAFSRGALTACPPEHLETLRGLLEAAATEAPHHVSTVALNREAA